MSYSIELNYGDHIEERSGYRSLIEAHKHALDYIKEVVLNHPDAFVLIHNNARQCVEHLSYNWENGLNLEIYTPTHK